MKNENNQLKQKITSQEEVTILATKRTKLSNTRTFLSYIRTSLVFISVALAFLKEEKKIDIITTIFFCLSGLFFIFGIIHYLFTEIFIKKQ